MPASKGIDFGMIVKGDKRLLRNLKRLETKFEKKVLNKAMRDTAKKLIMPEAKKEAPVKSGKLRKGIRIRAAKRWQKERGEVAIVIRTATPKEMKLDHSFNYPWVVHHGRKPNAKGKGAISPNPFMKRAFDRIKNKIRERVALNLRRGITKLIK